MTTEMWIIAAVRTLGALPVLRWPLAGGLIALLADLSDLFLMDLLHLGGVRNYQAFDKWLDQAYMATFLATALRRWPGTPGRIAAVLYAYRLAGFAVFEATGERDLLLLFPNVFEFWFLSVAGIEHFRIRFRYSRKEVALALAGLLVVKEFQEYALHYARWLDSFTSIDAVKAIWRWLTSPLR